MISINKESLTQDIIEIPLVLINNPEIIYEYNGKKTNFNVLKENIQSYQNNGSNISQEKKSTKATENKEIKDTKIKKLLKLFLLKN